MKANLWFAVAECVRGQNLKNFLSKTKERFRVCKSGVDRFCVMLIKAYDHSNQNHFMVPQCKTKKEERKVVEKAERRKQHILRSGYG